MNLTSRLGKTAQDLGLVLILTLGALIGLQAQSYTIDKEVLGVEASSTSGHINVLYQVTFTNVSEAPTLTDVQITDNVLIDFGTVFVGVASAPQIVASTAGTDPSPNPNYSGDFANPGLLMGDDGFVAVGQSFTVAYSIEIDPALTNNDLTNTAAGSASLTAGGPTVTPTPISSATLTNCWNDCVLACNNQVNISVNTMCEAEILAEMILEGENQECADLGFYVVELFDLDDNPIALPLDASYIGDQLKVVVTNIACGNSCWSNILVEDKTPPVLDCGEVTVRCNENISPFNPLIGFPVPVNNITPTADPNVFIASSIDACGDVDLMYRDSLVKRDCTDPVLSSTIYRKWTATDASGLMVMCWDTINFIRGTIADITLPDHFDGQPGNQPELDCDGTWDRLPNGFPAPTPGGTGAPEGIFCGNIQFDYSDDTIAVCDGTYKLFRTWLIVDWCDPDNKVEFIQRIKVTDIDPPIVIAPPLDPLVLTMDHWECNRASYIVPEPIFDPSGAAAANNPYVPVIIDECGSWTYRVEHLTVDETIKDPSECAAVDLNQAFNTYNVRQLSNGSWELFDIPAGCNWIKYIITDDCGNEVVFSFDIFIEDNVSPIAVCHEHTVVSLTSDGKARVNAETFDDGSHDNCGMGKMEVRRMNSGNCPQGVQDDTQFRDYVEFCCEDIADNPIMVVLRVYDECGNNFSECMVEVEVQDKLPPIITSCPGPETITCEDNPYPLSQFGMAEAFDNCNVEVTVDSTINLSDCGVGEIIRTFTATDDGGRTASCTQVITVVDSRPFTIRDITWPQNRELFNGCMEDTDPDNTGRPTFRNEDDCNQIATSYEDLVFSQVDGSCLKILRQWRVVDWCQFDRNNPDECFPVNAGRWCFTQVIKVNDSQGPEFTSDCNDRIVCIDGPGCEVTTTLEATAFDECTPSNLLIWSYEIDLDDNGNVDLSGNRSQVTGTFQEGEHRITWTVEDQCGNVDQCSYIFDVQDCKKPTPYCESGVVTVIMPSTGTITLWASDFDAGSFDNCTDTTDLTFSFSADRNETSREYDCGDIANGVVDTIEVTIYVWDDEGNSDFCVTSLILQDNQDVCQDVANANSMIAGLVSNLSADKMKNVEVVLESPSMSTTKAFMTDANGKFAFPGMSMYENYVVKPGYNKDHLNGISTLDLVMIQRHLLGYQEFTSPYKYIAADVNNSQSVSAGDISELRKLILGLYSELPRNASWRFVDEAYLFPDEKDPFPFNEEIRIDDLRGDEMDNNFMAIKVGDVSGDAIASGALENGTRNDGLTLSSDEVNISGSQVSVPVIIEESSLDVFGFQFTLNYDASRLEFAGITSDQVEFNADQYALISEETGTVTVSWHNAEGVYLTNDEAAFNVEFNSVNGGFADEWVSITDDVTPAQLYTVDGETYTLRWSGSADVAEGYVLHQNTPNPFQGVTTIGFEMPAQQEYRLEVFDMSGKVVKTFEGLGQRGYQSLDIDLSGFSDASVLYYQLNTGSFSATKKMVIIE